VAAEADRFARRWVPPRLVSDTQGLRALCAEGGLVPFIVSASPLSIVVAAAPLAGFERERCRGIEVRIRGGKFTAEVVKPVSYAAGKIAAAAPFGKLALACGDSLHGDLPMLEAAQIAVVVAPRSGSPLSIEAQKRRWSVLSQES
jgi:phosphoserine phosphatase